LILSGTLAALSAVACSNSNMSLLPTAPSAVAGVSGSSASDQLSTASFDVLGRGKSPEQRPEAKRPEARRVEVSGRVEAIDLAARTLVVQETEISVPLDALIRHGSRLYVLDGLQVGDKVQVKGTITGATVTATEVKLSGNPHREDDGDGDDEEEQPPVQTEAAGR
jgi:hypothetical protein